GHHHILYHFRGSNKIYINPGSLKCNSKPVANYAIINIKDDGCINCTFKEVLYDNQEFLLNYYEYDVLAKEALLNIFHGNQDKEFLGKGPNVCSRIGPDREIRFVVMWREEGMLMIPIKKAYGYVTRVKEGKTQVLVFRHPSAEAGIQIPKGTVEPNESTYNAVIREIEEETGLKNFEVENLIADDYWEYDDGTMHNRYFYKINVSNVPDTWEYNPTGSGGEERLTFDYFWISSEDEVELIRGHGDYLNLIFI